MLEGLSRVAGTVNSTPFLHVPNEREAGSPPRMDKASEGVCHNPEQVNGRRECAATRQDTCDRVLCSKDCYSTVGRVNWSLPVHDQVQRRHLRCVTSQDPRPELGQGLSSLFSMWLTCVVRWLWSALEHGQKMIFSSPVLTK